MPSRPEGRSGSWFSRTAPTDEDSVVLSRDIARKIEKELTYPGQIKVTVIREMRAVDIAK